MTQRLIPTSAVAARPITVNGRTWTCPLNSTIDVPDGDALALTANGFIVPTTPIGAGPTSARPTQTPAGTLITAGYSYLDTSVGYVIVFDGAAWRNPCTGGQV